MADETQKLLALLREAQSLAEAHFGVSNILQPGIIKEIMMAGVLGHKVVANKGLHDAEDLQGRKYEYLASINRRNVRTNRGASFQIDRITEDNLTRVTRNAAFYFGFFEDHLNLEKIIRVETLSNGREDLSGLRESIFGARRQ